MIKEVNLSIPPSKNNPEDISKFCASNLNINTDRVKGVRLLKRSIDARGKKVLFRLKVEVFIDENKPKDNFSPEFKKVSDKQKIIIVGAGPAGLFAGLRAIELGLKPILIERGKKITDRRRDIAKLNKEHIVNPESNYCFGEGGAGTFSDGKLYTRSKKRGNIQKVLETFVHYGAVEDILADAHPHIGTNKLPQIITSIRESIIENGGEVHFESKMTDVLIENNQVIGIEVNNNQIIESNNVVLATGHSARDIFYLLDKKKIALEFKPFALGVRVEHPQSFIDSIQYRQPKRSEFLPPASYSLVTNVKNRGVFSFCMCPGGIVAPCATDTQEVVTNGWSPSKRNNPYSNSGIVVSINEEDVSNFNEYGALKGLKFQESIEKISWESAGKSQAVPAQCLADFMNNTRSMIIPKSSYLPGVRSVELNTIFPEFIIKSLKFAFQEFDKKMKGFITNDAILHAPESRTSSPVRIPRDKNTFEHIQIEGLYPCAEGAGYAGGIISAAVDGQLCVEKIVEKMNSF